MVGRAHIGWLHAIPIPLNALLSCALRRNLRLLRDEMRCSQLVSAHTPSPALWRAQGRAALPDVVGGRAAGATLSSHMVQL